MVTRRIRALIFAGVLGTGLTALSACRGPHHRSSCCGDMVSPRERSQVSTDSRAKGPPTVASHPQGPATGHQHP